MSRSIKYSKDEAYSKKPKLKGKHPAIVIAIGVGSPSKNGMKPPKSRKKTAW